LLAKLSINAVKKNKGGNDISFYLFVTHSQTCQWLPQVQRVVAWVCTVLLDKNDEEASRLAVKCQLLGVNVHSLHLVTFFGEEYQTACMVNSQIDGNNKGMPPSYLSTPGDNSISKKELIMQHCIQGSELSWEDIGLGFFPLDFVFSLVETYHQPLKLLSTIPPSPLFHLLESATRDRYTSAVSIIERALLVQFGRNSSHSRILVSKLIVCLCTILRMY
jgi:hypothetical protein